MGDFLPHIDVIKKFDNLPKFINRPSSHKLHLSLQNVSSSTTKGHDRTKFFQVGPKDSQNTEKAIGIWTAHGRIELTIEKYLEAVDTLNPDTFDCYSDSDTASRHQISSKKGEKTTCTTTPVSKKRLQKATERTIKFTKKCVELCKTTHP